MCGICGFVSTKNGILSSKEKIIRDMSETLSSRGPDGAGTYYSGNVVFGHRRLSVIDLNTGAQPMFSSDKSLVIVYNGEIYNFLELKMELMSRGHVFRTNSDTEVLLASYEEWGADCLNKFNGMFVFAIHDLRNNSIFIARDRIGVKPLHYFFSKGDFAFASELKSLLRHPDVSASLDFDSLDQYLTFEYVPAPKTIFKGVSKLMQGCYLIYKDNSVSVHQYWNADFQNKLDISDDEASIRLRALIDDAVKVRLISDVPLGAFLSGGIDSSLITYFMCRHSSKKVKTFSVSFNEKSFDESSYARDVSRFLGTEHHEERLDANAMLDILPEVMKYLDEPFADPSIIPTYLLSRFTRKSVTVALSGDGGDEVFAGYPTYQAHKIARFLPKFLSPVLNSVARLLPVSDDNISFDFKVKRILSGAQYEPFIRHQIWLGSFSPKEKESLLTFEAKERISAFDEFGIVKYYNKKNVSAGLLDRLLYQDLNLYLQDNMLVKVDRASMANSLEVRNPYLDFRVVDFAASLPEKMKLRYFTTKYILKKAAHGLLPDNIINRPKKGFGIPVAKWFKGKLKPLMLEMLAEEKLKKEGIFDYRFIAKLIEDHLRGRADNRKLLWTVFVFELWREYYK